MCVCLCLHACGVLQVGFLYLRYVADPRQLWSWLGPYCDDQEVRSGVGLCVATCCCRGWCCCCRVCLQSLDRAILLHADTLETSIALQLCFVFMLGQPDGGLVCGSSTCWWAAFSVSYSLCAAAAVAVAVAVAVAAASVSQEIQPSGPNGPTVPMGDFVRDLLLEQVRTHTAPHSDMLGASGELLGASDSRVQQGHRPKRGYSFGKWHMLCVLCSWA
jgi:hypothetical protein